MSDVQRYVASMEALLDEIEPLKEDMKALKAEAKSNGINVKALVKLVAFKRSYALVRAECELDAAVRAYGAQLGVDVGVPE